MSKLFGVSSISIKFNVAVYLKNRFTEDSLHFKGVSVDETRHYEVTLNFLHKINPEKVATKNTARCIEFCIAKAESGPYWTSLTSDKKKPHFLKADFNKWRDEDSDNEEGTLPEHGSFYFCLANHIITPIILFCRRRCRGWW